MTLVLQWRVPEPAIKLQWRTSGGMLVALSADPLTPLAGFLVPSGNAVPGLGGRLYAASAFTEAMPLALAAGVRTAIALPNPESGDVDLYQGQYSGRQFISQGKVQPSVSGETFGLRVNIYGSSTVISNRVIGELDIGGSEGVIDQDSDVFDGNAGTTDRLVMKFEGFALATFLANGGTLYLTAQQNCSVWGFSALHLPLSVPS